jgi:hypothetical protein
VLLGTEADIEAVFRRFHQRSFICNDYSSSLQVERSVIARSESDEAIHLSALAEGWIASLRSQ